MSIFGTFEAIKNEFSNRVSNASFLSPPRKSVNSPLKPMSSTSSYTSAESSDEEEKPIVNKIVEGVTSESTDHSMPSDPSVNTDKLPDDHPIHLEDEARKFFGDSQPPFVLKKRPDITTKNVVIPTASGGRPQQPTVVQVVARPWDKSTMCWTLDLNGLRYIVKPFGGAPIAGMKYLWWAGPELDFDSKPLAFTQIDMAKMKARYPKAFQSANGEMPPKRSRKRQRTGFTASSSESDDDLAAVSESSTSLQQQLSELDPRLQGPLQPIKDNTSPDSATVPNGTKNALEKGKKPTRHSELPQRIAAHVNGGETHASRAAAAKKRRKTDIPAREISGLQDFFATAPRPSATQHSDSASSSLHAEQAKAGAEQHRSHKKKPPTAQAASKDSNAEQAPTYTTTLSLQKQQRTTLLIRVSPLAEYQPLRLSGCPDLQSFFYQVLSVWEADPVNVAKVTVTFLWMDSDDKMRTMVMNPKREACWSHLLEQVDEAPCWDEEKGRCMIDVEIVFVE